MIIQITFRAWTGRSPLEIEIGAEYEHSSEGVKLGAAVKIAFGRRADLSGAVLSGADLSGADLSGADLRGADLRGADLSRAILRGADLRGADLSRAILRGADLSRADLSGAVLSGADLSGADLSGAVLSGADLSRAILRGAVLSGAPIVPSLHRRILAALESGGTLKMDNWHTCRTTHCRAGWAIHLAGDAGYALEERIGSAAAGALITLASCPGIERMPNFYASNADALADIKASAEKEPPIAEPAS